MKNTVRTSIKTTEYEINLDCLSTNAENFIQLNESDNANNTVKTIALTENNSNVEINITITEGEETKDITFAQSKEVNGNTMIKRLSAQYEDSNNRVEAYMTQNYQTVTQFDNELTLDSKNSIKLNDLQQEQLQSLMGTVQEGVNGKIEELQNEVNMQEIQQVLINAGLLKEEQSMEVTGTTESEKTRYNSQFEMLVGKNFDADRVLNAINASQNYINNLEVVSNTELRIVLNRSGNNPEIVTTLQNFIEEHKGETYNISLEYDEQTGLVSSFLLTIVTDE